ncbi:MAG TPA: hypothetical protein VJ963_12490 [Bacteroidales bacterium]|nr:hypothetical protein [Bacteroidales bacterium]
MLRTFLLIGFSFIILRGKAACFSQIASIDTIYAKQFDKQDDNYEPSIEAYKFSEIWGNWSMPIGKAKASSALDASGNITYTIKNIDDYDLNTAWIGKKGSGDYFEFTFHFPENTSYAGAYQFYGICNLFNGYCKSIKIWQANSRVKMLKVYYNNIPICYVLLKDTWQFQTFDIGKYFINRRFKKYMDAHFEIKNGDVLKFEIVSVYKGSKYKDVAISEFLSEGAGN